MPEFTLEQTIDCPSAAVTAVPDAMRAGFGKSDALIEGETQEIIGHYQRADETRCPKKPTP